MAPLRSSAIREQERVNAQALVLTRAKLLLPRSIPPVTHQQLSERQMLAHADAFSSFADVCSCSLQRMPHAVLIALLLPARHDRPAT